MALARPGRQLRELLPSTRWLSVLIAVGVLIGAAGLVLTAASGSSNGTGKERQAVLNRATDFAVTYNTYEVKQTADYQSRMKELLAPAYFEEFNQVTDAVFSALESKNQSSGDAKVLSAAVESLNGSSATVLVAVDAVITTDGKKAGIQRRFRWRVSLEPVDGDWKVNQFETVVPLEAETGEPELTPSDLVTPGEPSTEGPKK